MGRISQQDGIRRTPDSSGQHKLHSSRDLYPESRTSWNQVWRVQVRVLVCIPNLRNLKHFHMQMKPTIILTLQLFYNHVGNSHTTAVISRYVLFPILHARKNIAWALKLIIRKLFRLPITPRAICTVLFVTGLNMTEILIRVSSGKRPSVEKIPEDKPSECEKMIGVMQQCWHQDCTQRLAFSGTESHFCSCFWLMKNVTFPLRLCCSCFVSFFWHYN